MTRDSLLVRLGGLAALAGAALRAATAFPRVHIPALGPQALYFTIDLLLTAGLVAIFCGVGRMRTWLGALGGLGALAGLLLIRTGDRLGGADGYQRGAAVLALGLALAGLAMLGGKGLTRFAGVAWLASFAVGAAGAMLRWPLGFTVASLLFCAGFALAGVVAVRGGEQA